MKESREKTKGDTGGRETQAFSGPMMTLREQADARSDTDNYDVRNGDQKNRNVDKNFSVTHCILLQLDIRARKFQLAFISKAAHQIMILA